MCRDIAEAQKGRSVMSVVCCGHSPKSRIEHMAFKPDGSFLVQPCACSLLGFCPWKFQQVLSACLACKKIVLASGFRTRSLELLMSQWGVPPPRNVQVKLSTASPIY
jgi:hypothetical protein